MEDILDFGPVEDTTRYIIKVVGVGGGGCNAVCNMYNEGIEDVTFAVCNTDSKALSSSPVRTKVLLGDKGHGAGNIPSVGREEAEKSREQLEQLFSDGTRMAFITAGMGGGTGTGAAPVVASIAKEKGLLTVGVVTIPFYFEKKRKIIQALKGVDEMRKHVDALLIVNNERINDIYSDADIPVRQAMQHADCVLSNAVKSISELITIEGDINLDFCDVQTTMGAKGGAIMAIGRGSGERRVTKAFLNALESPLLYGSDIGGAKRILFNIYSSPEHPIFVKEMRQIDDFMDELNPDIEVIWGLSDEEGLGEDAKVAILATGLQDDFCKMDDEGERDYEALIKKLYQVEPPQPVCPPDKVEDIPLEVNGVNVQSDEGDEETSADSGESLDSEYDLVQAQPHTLLDRMRLRVKKFASDVMNIDAD